MNETFTTPYKDDDSKFAELKQQIAQQKIILYVQHIAECHCAAK